MPTTRESAIACLREGRILTMKELRSLGYKEEWDRHRKLWSVRFLQHVTWFPFDVWYRRLDDCAVVATADARVRFAKELEK